MALKSIKGTTSQIEAALLANEIGIETSVTITDNLYDSTVLLDIIAKTNKTITLTYTAAGTPISASPEDLVTILAQVNKYTGPLTVTGIITTAEQLNYIAKKTTGIVTATLAAGTPISKATVDALKDVSSSDNITFAPSQLLVKGKSDLEALVALSKKLPKPNTDWTAVDDFEGTASEVAAIKAALKVVDTASVNITIGQISAADASAIAKGTTGDVTATIKDGSVAATLKALKDVADDLTGTNTLTFKSTDKTADAKALAALDALLGSANTDFSSVQTITSKATDIGTSGDNVTDALVALGAVPTVAAVTITNGTISAADASTISTATNGKVTATITPDTAENIADDLTGAISTDALNITVDGATASVADLKLIVTQTALKVKVNAAEVTALNFDAFEDIYVTGKNNFSNLGDEKITIAAAVLPADDISSAQADIVAKATSKVVTATLKAESAASVVTNLKNANAKDAFTITLLNDTNGTSAKDLLTLDGKTSETVNAVAITSAISGTVAEVNKLLVADVTLASTRAFNLTGTVKAADANNIILNDIIFNAGAGSVTATNVTADTAAKLDAALANARSTDVLNLKVNGATAAAADLITLNGKTAGKITVDAKEITGTAADVTTVLTDAGNDFIGEGKAAVKVTDVAAAGAVNTILATTGVVTATVTADTASALNTALTNATAKDKLTLTVNDAAAATDASDLNDLDDKTAVKVDASAVTAITGTAAQLKKLVAAKGVEVAKGVDIDVVELLGGTTNASDLATILKSTLGKVTATVTADTAAKLNAALKDAISSDDLALTVNGTTATAKDLISLDGKTIGTITLNVGAITGNIAEITKVFVTDATNFSGVVTKAATISGTITADQADLVAVETNKAVTATIKADTAKALNDALSNTEPIDGNAYKLTVKGDYTNSADAADLLALDGKTSVTVNAAAIKNIDGTGLTGAADVKAAYVANALNKISGLGNETVDLSKATDANVSLVKAINDYTTGVITLPTITFEDATNPTTFNLKQLGDLKGITGLVNIDATNTVKDTISISLNDLLAANDSKNNFTFKVTGDNGAAVGSEDSVKITNDLSGWTQTKNIAAEHTYTNGKTGQVVTIELVDAVFAV